VEQALVGVLSDAQTSGGLLLSVAPNRGDALNGELRKRGLLSAEIGLVCDRSEHLLILRT
jgi:hypothetical protein